MVFAGVTATLVSALYLLASYLRAPKQTRFPVYGVAGLVVIGLAEMLLYFRLWPVTVYFTPIVWTGYILAIDGAVYSLRKRSLLRSEPGALAWMAVLSIFLWAGFEAYNLRLVNWMYVGLPQNEYLRYLGYGWSFATIWPAVLETTEFVLATQFRHRSAPVSTSLQKPAADARPLHLESAASTTPPTTPPARNSWGWVVLGLAMVTVPLLAPRDQAQYMFALVWLGFIFLIDPLNHRAGSPSILGDLALGYSARLWALLIAGGLCGFFWEFWNYWADAKWLYIFPILEDWRVFEMPVLGFLGFPAFAVEIFVLYIFTVSRLNLPAYETR